jgi:Rieske Fe-S protein
VAELQRDPITRSDFLGFGLLGTIMGAILTIPPVAFLLSPVIKTNVLGETDVDQGWVEVGSIVDVKEDEPSVFEIEFPINQAYAEKQIQEEIPESPRSKERFTIRNAIWVSWKAPITVEGRQGSGGDELSASERPAILDQKTEGFTQSEREEIMSKLNVLSNSCAHLGCPVRWFPDQKFFLCPCHGGLYDINGGYVGGPPPRGMYRYPVAEVREDGKLYVKHEYDVGPEYREKGPQRPYVV